MMLPLLAGLRVGRPLGRPRTRPDRVLADKAYSSRAIRSVLGVEHAFRELRPALVRRGGRLPEFC
jgi:hypothetical protein